MTGRPTENGPAAGRSRERVVVAELMVRVYDRGPEPDRHMDRGLFAPWQRYEAELPGGASALGCSPWEALYRLVANQREQLADAGVRS